jgi:5'-nucleotidase
MLLLTNDDGVYSPGLISLAKALGRLTEVKVVAPRGAQSSSGMSVTFHRPVSVSYVKVSGYEATAVSGTPSDCVFISVHKLFKRKRIEMIISGINLGENVSMQSFFSSGTVSAAMSGSIIGIRSIAFSKEIPAGAPHLTIRDFGPAAWWASKIVSFILNKGFPPGVDLLNVNFPLLTTRRTGFRVTSMAHEVFEDYVVERKDPRGNRYFWLAGNKKVVSEEGTDAHVTLKEGKISITPISISSIHKETDRSVHEHLAGLLSA